MALRGYGTPLLWRRARRSQKGCERDAIRKRACARSCVACAMCGSAECGVGNDLDLARLLNEQVSAALFVHHPYGTPIIGWQHEIRKLTTADALAFYRDWYAPNNAILVVAGDVDAATLRPLAERYYGVIPARPVPGAAPRCRT